MLLSLPHPHLCISSKVPDSSSPPFLSLPAPKAVLCFQHRKTPTSPARASASASNPKTLAKSAIERISEKLRKLGYIEENPSRPTAADRPPTGPGSAGEIFIPTPHELPKHRVGYTIDSSWSTPEHPVPEPGANIARFHGLWRREKVERARARPAAPVPSVAELTIPAEELRRLRTEGIRLDKRLKVGKAGITEGIVNGIHERWQRSELVKIKCEDLCRLNMKRTHETLERKTGGLVVWRSGSIIILYRGANYKYPYFHDEERDKNLDEVSLEPSMDDGNSSEQEGNFEPKAAENPSEAAKILARSSLVMGVGSPKKVRLQLPGEVQLEEEADRLLDGLGPRFIDWWGCNPLPIDADLLPAIVPRFRKPFRLLPFGVKPKLTDREMTILRRLGRPLPCHFALGRNRNLRGLAVSMIKLWEKCEIAKIAIKRGAQNTNSEMMAEELKQLTGGTLLSRDKEFIVYYRGKDFLPPAVSTAIEERRNYEIGKQKQNMVGSSPIVDAPAFEPRFTRPVLVDENGANEQKRSLAKVKRLTSGNLAIKRVEAKLSQVIEKKETAEKLLEELENSAETPIIEPDREAISEEERYMLRKVGLRMKPFLLLGRRGVFDGTIENMHLHWKYRELVKIIFTYWRIEHVHEAARTLEAESGGILVAVERVSKGHAIIVYRGKNYQRPAHLRPKTLLNKKEALKRSLEAQRRESLKLHVLSLSKNIDRLKQQMVMNDSLTDSMQLLQHDAHIAIEKNENGGSTYCDNISMEFVHHQENLKEVHGADAESLHSNKHNALSSQSGEIINMPTNDKLMESKCDVSVKPEVAESSSELSNDTSTSNNESGCISDVCASHPEVCLQQSQVSGSTPNSISHASDEDSTDLSFEETQCKPESSAHDKVEDECHDEIPFKAAPLSNRERLILRKQALKMRKRPVLAVGRSNVLAGVVKTIKTHFRKHPLAIVNIKGRAKGTSVQELIFELEQATGAVLVSREPNKVILYRGWGEGEVPGGTKEKDVGKISRGTKEAIVSPQLMAAVRRECGFQTSQVEQLLP